MIRTKLIDALKLALKEQGLTYEDLAQKLGVGHSTIRRMFSQKQMGLDRFDDICNVLKLDFEDLNELLQKKRPLIQSLTYEQELALSKNAKLFALFYLITADMDAEGILKHYFFERGELEKLLLKLDQLDLIELSTQLKFKARCRSDVKWNKHGPLFEELRTQARKEFWNSDFRGEFEHTDYLYLRLSPRAQAQVIEKLTKLKTELETLAKHDEEFGAGPKQNYFLAYAIRPWVLSLIDQLRRPKEATKKAPKSASHFEFDLLQ